MVGAIIVMLMIITLRILRIVHYRGEREEGCSLSMEEVVEEEIEISKGHLTMKEIIAIPLIQEDEEDKIFKKDMEEETKEGDLTNLK